MGGAIKELLVSLFSGGHRARKKRQLQTVELRVRMDCERCEREVRRALAGIRGVKHVEVNRKQQKLTVTGIVDPHKVLRGVQSSGKRAEMWAQNPGYSTAFVTHRVNGEAQAHERWAPASYPRSTEAVGAEQITDMFSEDNPNACSIM